MKAKVYVAGPYSTGDTDINTRNAIEAANKLADLGYAPFVPHLFLLWNIVFPRPYEFWIELDNEFIPSCDALLRIPGKSPGADKEVVLAESLNIPVFESIAELDGYFSGR